MLLYDKKPDVDRSSIWGVIFLTLFLAGLITCGLLFLVLFKEV